ncbi:enolase C-terminal domain-like protein [Roseitranquillus sediminis]|uniref:enolase C-terminal domain-like protein n=1 Tax=Roseitranquillus sediminis TaxID=2809051 RepID=UPI001D0C3F6C|nr:enolase C-terminal domain-like protein [Roseitranquillus sediminis]MBM9595989.1 mandelate racemase [Roseitranquillus sediminis]
MSPEAPITGVRTAAYRVPTDRPEGDGTLAWDATVLVTCEIEAGGQTGFGYVYADSATALFASDVLAGVLQGRDGLATAARWREMVDAVRNHGRQGVAAMAISLCDAALHDLRGKYLGASLSTLLGRRREAVPVYGSGGFTTYAPSEMDAQIEGWVDAGFHAVKIKVTSDLAAEAPRIARARRAAGDGAALMIDANGACSRKQALKMADFAAASGVVWFEEPVSSDDVEGLRLVRDQAPAGVELAAGEYGYDAFHFRRLLEAGAVDVLQADATRCCGITGLLQADALAWAATVPLSIHCAPALHLQAALCLQRLIHMEWFHDHVRIEDMLMEAPPVARNGVAIPEDDRPGLGLALKQADAEPFRIWPRGPA